MKAGEGELSFHTRTCEGGQCLFLCTTNGKVIMIEEERSCQRPSPYINKFGETFSSSSKKWESYQIPSAMPGQGFYEEYKKMYMNFSIANEVIKDRSMAEVLWRMRVI